MWVWKPLLATTVFEYCNRQSGCSDRDLDFPDGTDRNASYRASPINLGQKNGPHAPLPRRMNASRKPPPPQSPSSSTCTTRPVSTPNDNEPQSRTTSHRGQYSRAHPQAKYYLLTTSPRLNARTRSPRATYLRQPPPLPTKDPTCASPQGGRETGQREKRVCFQGGSQVTSLEGCK